MICGNKVLLRPPLDEDKEFFFALRNDFDLQSLLLSRPRANSIQRVLEWLEKRLADNEALFFVLAEKQSNRACGFIQLTNIDLISRTGFLGICLGSDYQGEGYAQDALKLFEEYSRNIFNIRKIMMEVLSNNEHATEFYLKSGYRQVGIWKEHVYQLGQFHDVTLMEKLI